MDRDALLKAHGLAHRSIADALAPTEFARSLTGADNYPRLTLARSTNNRHHRPAPRREAKDLAGQLVVIKDMALRGDEGDFSL